MKTIEVTQEMNSRYKQNDTQVCPLCHSKDLSANENTYENDYGIATVQKTCGLCKATWTEVYVISAIANLRQGE